MAPQQHSSAFSIQNVNIFSDVLIRHGIGIRFSVKYFLSQTGNCFQVIILCCEVFERNGIIETTAAHSLKKVRWLS